MSVAIMMKNQSGVTFASDSRLITYTNGYCFKIYDDHCKIYTTKDKKTVFCATGLVEYKDKSIELDVLKILEHKTTLKTKIDDIVSILEQFSFEAHQENAPTSLVSVGIAFKLDDGYVAYAINVEEGKSQVKFFNQSTVIIEIFGETHYIENNLFISFGTFSTLTKTEKENLGSFMIEGSINSFLDITTAPVGGKVQIKSI